MPAPPEMWQFLPICAQEPTVAQVSTMVPSSDVGAEIDERGHQHHARRDIGRAAHDRAGDRAEAGAAEIVGRHAGELGRDLVPPGRSAGGARDGDRVVEAEREQDRLLEPLVDGPPGRRALGDADLSLVEEVERRFHRIADDARGALVDALALLPDSLDRALQLGCIGFQ